MEAIREYLKNLFMSLPETPEVLRAKAELMEMMEDKYEELISEGKSEQEAVGTVISEFGNLEELAEELGIQMYMEKGEKSEEGSHEDFNVNDKKEKAKAVQQPKRQYRWTYEDVRDYLKYAWSHAACIGIGVMFCIFSPYVDSVLSGASTEGYIPRWAASAIGSSVLFLLVALAVALFCIASHMSKQYKKISKLGIALDEKAARLAGEKRGRDEQKSLWMRVIGIVFCIISVVPSSMNYFRNALVREAIDSSVLVLAGIGVCLIVISCSVGNRYEALMKAVRNSDQTGGEQWASSMYTKRTASRGPVFAVIIILFTALVGSSIVFGVCMRLQGYGSVNTTVEEQYDMEGIKEIRADLDMCELTIEYGNVEKICYKYSGSDHMVPVVTNRNGVFEVEEKGNSGFHLFHFGLFSSISEAGGRTVSIVLPQELAEQQAQSDLKYDINVDAGQVVLNDISGTVLKLDVDAGNVEGAGCTFTGRSQIDVDAGNVEFDTSSFRDLKVDVDAGDFSNLNSTTPLDYYTMDVDVDMGDVTINGIDLADGHIEQGRNVQLPEGEQYRMNVEVDMGSIVMTDR